jgi:DNA primase, catalytic core
MGGNVEEIKQRLDIAEVIGGYIKLEKSGVNYKARCPFHTEKTPSFFVSTVRQGYYCFGCGEKGDIFTFVEKMEGVGFRESLKILADKAGVELRDDRGLPKKDNSRLYQALEDATSFYQKKLKENGDAQKYLRSRGVSDESVESWRLGFAPDDWRTLRLELNSLNYTDLELTKAGLIKKSLERENSEPYDVFRGRLMFPIFDPKGEVIAFSGRALSKDTEPKYLNSPDTDLFNKSETLYGFDKAREEIRKKDYTILVEGQLDLVLSHQAGVKNTVASSGTAFTQGHLEKLKKLSPRILLAFDGDDAGMKASERSSLLAHSLGMEVKIAKLGEGKDPADLVKEDPENWKKILREAKTSVEALIEYVLSLEKDTSKAVRLVERKILPIIAVMSSKFERESAVSKVASILGRSPSIVAEMVSKIPILKSYSEEGERPQEAEVLNETRIEKIEKELGVVEELQKDFKKGSDEYALAETNKKELKSNLRIAKLEEEREALLMDLARGGEVDKLHKEIVELGSRDR